jgi:hypothetical protein
MKGIKRGEIEGREHKAGENGRAEGEDGRLERTNVCESERKEGRKEGINQRTKC